MQARKVQIYATDVKKLLGRKPAPLSAFTGRAAVGFQGMAVGAVVAFYEHEVNGKTNT
jgi:hypothetical protein